MDGVVCGVKNNAKMDYVTIVYIKKEKKVIECVFLYISQMPFAF